MRFSIQEQNGKKMFFHSPAAANKVTGLHLTTIKTILERGGNPTYHRKSDNKLFEIRKEDPIKILEIEGEDFFSLEEIQAKFGLSPTKFLNQVKNDKFAKKIDWISPELFPGDESETEKIDEAKLALEVLREEMRSQFEKFQAEITTLQAEMSNLYAEINRLSAKVEKASRPGELPSQEEKFKPPGNFCALSFNPQSLAKFIRNGLVDNVQAVTPKTHRYVLVNNKKEYLPDLVKFILQEHIVPLLTHESQEAGREFVKKVQDSYNEKANKLKVGEFFALRSRVRKLEPSTVMDISKEIMKLL